MSYIILIFSLSYAVLAYRRLDWAILAMIVGLPLYQARFNFAGVPFTVLELMILISFTVWAIKNYKKVIKNLKLKTCPYGWRVKNCLQITNLPVRLAGYKLQIRYPFDKEILLLLLISWIAIAIAGFTDSALGIWKAYFFEPVLVYILVVNVFSKKENSGKGPGTPIGGPVPKSNLNKLIWALVILSFWVSLVAILQQTGIISSPENFWPRVTGPFTYPNALGLLLSPLVLIMTTWFMNLTRTKNLEFRIMNNRFLILNSKFLILFLLVTIIMSVSAISLAHSEGAAVGVIIAMIIVGLLIWTRKRPKLMILPKAMIIFVFVGVMLSSVFFLQVIPEYKYFNFDKKILNYITDKAMLKDISGEIRKQQWRETWQVLSASPKNFIFGVGLSGYQTAVKPIHQEGVFFNFERDEKFRDKIVWFDEKYKSKHWQPVEIYMYPHNFFLNFWTELGLLGAILFVWIFIKFLIISFKLIERNKNNRFLLLGGIGAMIVMIVHGIVDVPYFKNDIAVLFWIILGILGIIILEIEQNKKTEL